MYTGQGGEECWERRGKIHEKCSKEKNKEEKAQEVEYEMIRCKRE
jgi:hypothetical protein